MIAKGYASGERGDRTKRECESARELANGCSDESFLKYGSHELANEEKESRSLTLEVSHVENLEW